MLRTVVTNGTATSAKLSGMTAAGKTGDNYGFFGADGDPMALQLIKDGTSYRGTIMTGAYDALPGAVDICIAGGNGEEVEGNIIYQTIPVTIDNVDEYLTEE
jgi:ABC-type sugar transport system substrate-binding protein